MQLGNISPTDVVYEHVSQHNQTNWQFLTELADAIGYVVTVADTALNFEPAPASSSGPVIGGHEADEPLQLVLGANLLRVRAVVTSAEQAGRIVVRGWAANNKEAVVGAADAATTSASLAIDPAELASVFGSPEFVAVGTPYANQDDVDAAARSVAEQLGGAFAELEGVCQATRTSAPALL